MKWVTRASNRFHRTGECVVGADTYHVKAGDLVPVPKAAAHSIRNTNPTKGRIGILAKAPLLCELVPVKPT